MSTTALIILSIVLALIMGYFHHFMLTRDSNGHKGWCPSLMAEGVGGIECSCKPPRPPRPASMQCSLRPELQHQCGSLQAICEGCEAYEQAVIDELIPLMARSLEKDMSEGTYVFQKENHHDLVECIWSEDDPDGCMMCSGEACSLCGAGCWAPPGSDCTHDVDERHTCAS